MIIRCTRCLIPTSRPDTAFEGCVCSACLAHERRPKIDWEARERMLLQLLDKFHGEVLVPSSGGKDSTYQAMTLKRLGANVTCVTAGTCHLTQIGRRNIDNLARHCTTIEVSPNRTVRAKLNRLGLEMVGDGSWPEHVAIFSIPWRMACDLGNPLIMYGENPQNQYGGPPGSQEAREMTLRWRSEFGGFLGLRPMDLVGIDGITERDMQEYTPPSAAELGAAGVEAHFLGQYLPWDSHRNAEVAIKAGMETCLPSEANWWNFENLDNAQTGIHDYMMWLKYGYGRAAAQLSVDIRDGRIGRDEALRICQQRDGHFPEIYAGVGMEEILERIQITRQRLNQIMDDYTNWEIMRRVEDNTDATPILIADMEPQIPIDL